LDAADLGLISGAKLEWEIPHNMDSGVRFGDYIRRTWQDRLFAQGILPTQWMLATAIDPMRMVIRGIYLGPTFARLVTVESKGYCNNSCKTTGRPPKWDPTVRPLTLPHYQMTTFSTALLSALQWTVNTHPQRSCVEPSDLKPSQAIELHRTYRRHRLYSVHGLLYRAKAQQAAEAQPERGSGSDKYGGYGAPVLPEYCPIHRIKLRNVLDFHLPARQTERVN
jgi:hypothetical protein